MSPVSHFLPALFFAAIAVASVTEAQPRPTAGAPVSPPVSAALSDIRYDVTFDAQTASTQTIRVRMTFALAPRGGPAILSLPAWTPGAYEVSNFARFILDFRATADGAALDWDKVDHDTWRIRQPPAGTRAMTVEYLVLANELDNAKSWSRADFAFFNGTTLFMYPEGRDMGFASTVTVQTEPTWLVTSQLDSRGNRTYGARNYHDLVDAPFFVGRFELDSMRIGGKWTRLATYPAGAFTAGTRAALWKHHEQMIPPQAAVFGETPWTTYTTMIVIDSTAGGSALEHAASHMGIYPPELIGTLLLPSITAHEIFHVWNVKRLRPAEMVPYRYDVPQPTTLLWVSEGITDYYADIVLVRGGIIDSSGFFALTSGKISQIAQSAPVALEDASLTSWIAPVDGTHYIYYPKGSLAGFMLDILIRDASDNRAGLDDVLRELYQSTYKRGAGFTDAAFWAAARRAANGKDFAGFREKYIDGREAFPWDSLLPLAGLQMRGDTVREPRIGLSAAMDSGGMRVGGVAPEGMAASAGVRPGDVLLGVGDVPVEDASYGATYRARYMNEKEGIPLVIRVRRGTQVLSLDAKLRFWKRVSGAIAADPQASPKAVRVRNGILRGK